MLTFKVRKSVNKSDLIAWKMKTRANQPCWIIRLAQFISLESWKCLFFFSVWYYDCWNQKLEIKTKSFPSKEKLCDYFIFFLTCEIISFRYRFLGCSAIALLFDRLLCLESPFQLALGIRYNKAVRNDILSPALIQMKTARANCIVQNRLNIHVMEVSF